MALHNRAARRVFELDRKPVPNKLARGWRIVFSDGPRPESVLYGDMTCIVATTKFLRVVGRCRKGELWRRGVLRLVDDKGDERERVVCAEVWGTEGKERRDGDRNGDGEHEGEATVGAQEAAGEEGAGLFADGRWVREERGREGADVGRGRAAAAGARVDADGEW